MGGGGFVYAKNTPASEEVIINTATSDPLQIFFQIGIDELEKGNYEPDELKIEQQEAPGIDETQLLELANRENEILLSGKRLPPTAYANRGHTNIHLAFMDSDNFKQAIANNQEILANVIYHAMGEGKAQEMREKGTGELGVQPRQQRTMAQGIMSGEAKAMAGAKVLGPELTPAGQEVK